MKPETSFAGMCERFGLSEGVLLLRNRQGQLRVASQHGFSRPIRQREFLEWAEEAAAASKGTAGAAEGHGETCRHTRKDQLGGLTCNSPALAWAPLMGDEEVAGLLVVGGRPARVERALSILARTIGMEIETQHLRERLGRLEQMAALGELVYQVAHEISNPLTAVVGYAELLAEGTPGPSPEPLQWLKSEAERALGIARNVLSLAHDQQEKRHLDLNGMLRRALALREYPLRVAGVEVRTELDPDLPLVEVSPVKMQQALLNIVINAEQALETVKGQRILRVCTRRDGAGGPSGQAAESSLDPWLTVEIYNNGPAIPAAWLEKIYEPFFTTKPQGVGTGLGLAIARSIVESAGGKIAAANEEGGVLFRLRLPAQSRPEAVSLREEPLRQRASLEGRRLLVVEDEPYIARLIGDVFQAEGCRVNICHTAEEAVGLLESHRFDALLSDLKLPGKGGRWLFERISGSDPALAQRTLFITGDTVSKSTVAFLRASGQPVLAKPFRVQEVKAAVENLLQGSNYEDGTQSPPPAHRAGPPHEQSGGSGAGSK